MTIDQCKARILAVLSQTNASYQHLRIEVGNIDYLPIFAKALKDLLLNGEVVRVKRIHYDICIFALSGNETGILGSEYAYYVPVDCPLNQ